MTSTINTTFYTSSTESLFLKYKKNLRQSCENTWFYSVLSTYIWPLVAIGQKSKILEMQYLIYRLIQNFMLITF